MFGSMGQTNVKNLGNGGTMDGDVTITGDLTVSGGIGLSLSEVIEGTSTIDVTNENAFVVRKDSSGGDIFVVDTTNEDVAIGGTRISSEGTTKRLKFHGSGDNYILTGCYDDNGWGYFNSYNNANGIQFYTGAGSFFFNNGNVSIGSATATNNLHIEADSGDEGITIHSAGDTSNAVILDANRSGADSGIGNMLGKWKGTLIGYMGFFSGADTTNKDDGVIKFATTPSGGSATVAMTITSSQRVGIGTDSPASATGFNSSNLTIHGSDPSLVLSDTGQDNFQLVTHANAFKIMNDTDDTQIEVID